VNLGFKFNIVIEVFYDCLQSINNIQIQMAYRHFSVILALGRITSEINGAESEFKAPACSKQKKFEHSRPNRSAVKSKG
jgi:hypothetical protein